MAQFVAAGALSDQNLLDAKNQPLGLFLDNAGGDYTLGADSVERAAELQALFNFTTDNDVIVLKFFFSSEDPPIADAKLNAIGGGTNVIVKTLSSDDNILFKSGEIIENQVVIEQALILVTSPNITPGEEVIKFNIIQYGYLK